MSGALVVHLALVAAFVACVLARDAYEILKRGRIDPEHPVVFAGIFVVMVAMWATWFLAGITAPSGFALPTPLRWVGLAVVAAGFVVTFGGILTLRGVENIDHLVTHGIFSRVRHPIYTGFILWIVGWVAYTGSVASLVVAPVALGSILWWRSLEERDLVERYGDAYVAYRETTWV